MQSVGNSGVGMTDTWNIQTTPLQVGKKPFKYLLVGGVNTAFGYGVSVGLYFFLNHWLHLVVIAVISNVINVSFSFLAYKLFVFRSKGIWWHEYFRSFIVYGGSALIGIMGLWALVDGFGIPFWLAQGLLMVISVLFSYVGHNRFTFRKK
jgi:putative flippase GtrA